MVSAVHGFLIVVVFFSKVTGQEKYASYAIVLADLRQEVSPLILWAFSLYFL